MTSCQTTLTVHLITSRHITSSHIITILHHMTPVTPHHMTWHYISQPAALLHLMSHDEQPHLFRLTSQPTTWSHDNMSLHHHPPRNGASHWLLALRAFSKKIFFWYIFFAPWLFRPRLAEELLVYCTTFQHFFAKRWKNDILNLKPLFCKHRLNSFTVVDVKTNVAYPTSTCP